ncbi:MAG: hypothetical protein P0107_08955 [Nitrosomonas sp.]|nr:hypothetical protein [Nitrosomonas sp.]
MKNHAAPGFPKQPLPDDWENNVYVTSRQHGGISIAVVVRSGKRSNRTQDSRRFAQGFGRSISLLQQSPQQYLQ